MNVVAHFAMYKKLYLQIGKWKCILRPGYVKCNTLATCLGLLCMLVNIIMKKYSMKKDPV